MTRAGRLRLWIVAVAAVLASPAWFAIGGARVGGGGVTGQWAIVVAALWQGGGLALLTWLLVTTPSDAIKLSRWASWAILSAGLVWFGLAAWWIGAPVLLVIMITAMIGVFGVLYQLEHFGWRASPWSVVVFFWSPAVWIIPIVRPTRNWGSGGLWVPLAVVVLIAASQYACICALRRGGADTEDQP